MNKDVIYIEPEDDITDIISRLKQAKQKVVALVPPSKPGVLRSAVNTKLIARTAKAEGKAVVFVTTDPGLMKLAAGSAIPVAKTLNSRPVIPDPDHLPTKSSEETVIDEKAEKSEKDQDASASSDEKSAKKSEKSAEEPLFTKKKKPAAELTSDDVEESDKKKKKKSGKLPSIEKYRKWIIIGVLAAILLIGFLIWALVFAPAAKVIVSIRTSAMNFSENVSFTLDKNAAKPVDGIFLIEEHKVEDTSEVGFPATGQKNVGDKASGKIVAQVIFSVDNGEGSVVIPAGTTFSIDGLSYTSNADTTISWDDRNKSCDNYGETGDMKISRIGCIRSATTAVTATAPGSNHNIGANSSGWSVSMAGVTAYNTSGFSGGTDKMVTVVQQSDIDTAKAKLESGGEGKEELNRKFDGDLVPISASYRASTSDPTSVPAVGQEVGEGVTPKLTATTTYVMFGVDKVKLDEFITKKTEAKLADDQRVYSTGKPFFERFSDTDGNYTAKLKTTTKNGPKVTEKDIMDKSKGRKIGEVQSILKSINGISSVKVEPSFFWVRTVPSDENKVTIELKEEE